MTAEIILRAVLIGAGVTGLLVAVLALAKKKMTETICTLWGVSALLLIALGLLIHPAKWGGDLSLRWLAPLVLTGAVLLFIAYHISTRVSRSICKTYRAAMEDALLRFEHENAVGPDCGQEHKELLVILPAYNEEESLPGFLQRLEEAGVGDIADLLVLDDGSTDGTCRVVKEMGYRCVSCAHLGYVRTLQTGYMYALRAGYRYVIQVDADGQHDPCNVQAIYRALQEPGESGRLPDIVLGSRFLLGGKSFPMPGVKLLSIQLFRWVLRMAAGRRITDPTTGLQGLSAQTVAYYAGDGNFDSRYPDANMLLQMLLQGREIQEIPAIMHERKVGKGMHSGLKPLGYMIRMAFSIPAVYIRERLLRGKREDEAQGR